MISTKPTQPSCCCQPIPNIPTSSDVDSFDPGTSQGQQHHNNISAPSEKHHTSKGKTFCTSTNISNGIPTGLSFDSSMIKIYVGSEEFITTRETIYKRPDSFLATIIQDRKFYNDQLQAFFLDRNPQIFRAILDYHRYEELHLPNDQCGYDLCRDLQFWGIPEDKVAKCCIHKLSNGRSEAEVYANVEYELANEFEDLLIRSFRARGLEKLKLNTYLFLEYPSFSRSAARWSTFFAFLIIVSTLNVAVMSHQIGRQNRTEIDNNTRHLVEFIDTKKWKKLWETDVATSLYHFDLSLVTLFTLEILIRFITGPDKFSFLKSWINVVDVVTILLYWVKFTLIIVRKTKDKQQWLGEEQTGIEIAVFLFTELQFLRMVRILKLARNFTGLRVLILVLKKSRRELVTLIVFIIVGMFFFSFVIYVVEINQPETFGNVLVAFWWSIVTMTTVGYGDHYPTGVPGMVVGALCAVAGMIISGLSIPILSNNFNIYYNTLEYQLGLKEKRILAIKNLKQEFGNDKKNKKKENSEQNVRNSLDLELVTEINNYDSKGVEIAINGVRQNSQSATEIKIDSNSCDVTVESADGHRITDEGHDQDVT